MDNPNNGKLNNPAANDSTKTQKEKKPLNKKNIAIIVLSFLLFCCLIGSSDTQDYQSTINYLENTVKIYQENNNLLQNQVTNLQDKNSKLKEEITNLSNEKDELQKTNETLKTQQVQSNNSSISTTQTNNNVSTPNNPTQSTVQQDTNSEMVWVGNTGTKYHIQSCRTLKGNGHQITYQQAISEGREACKVCH